jgi:predicted phosphoribosyltransferase
MQFENRRQAGRLLAKALIHHAGRDALVLGLPRGGVPVAYEVAATLEAPLDVLVVRKIGVPFQPELGMGAIAEGPSLYVNRDIVETVGISSIDFLRAARREAREVRARVARFRGGRLAPDVRDRIVILVDDGIATGGTTRAAIKSLRKRRAGHIVLAVPVAAPEIIDRLRREVDEVVCLLQPRKMYAIGMWYEDFSQVSDVEVMRLLELARTRSVVAHEVTERGPM